MLPNFYIMNVPINGHLFLTYCVLFEISKHVGEGTEIYYFEVDALREFARVQA